MASEGPLPAGTGASVDNGVGSYDWTNASNITASDDTYATSALAAAGTPTDYLVSGSHGHAIPAGSIIDGIEITVEASRLAGLITMQDQNVLFTFDGGATSAMATPKGNGANTVTTSDQTFTYGGAADLWGGPTAGGSFNATDFNGTGFGVMWSAITSGGGGTCRVDYVTTKIYYTAFDASGHAGHYSQSSRAPLRLWNHIVEVQGF